MKLRAGRIALIAIAAFVIWLVGSFALSVALVTSQYPSYNYSVNGGPETVVHPEGWAEAQARSSMASNLLGLVVLVGLIAVIVTGTRPGRWLTTEVQETAAEGSAPPEEQTPLRPVVPTG
jgi:hypothetical protein